MMQKIGIGHKTVFKINPSSNFAIDVIWILSIIGIKKESGWIVKGVDLCQGASQALRSGWVPGGSRSSFEN